MPFEISQLPTLRVPPLDMSHTGGEEGFSRDSLLSQLLSSEQDRVGETVERLVSGLHQGKDQLVRCFLDDARSQDFLLALCRCLASGDTRLCSNVAYVLGTIAENDTGAQRLVAVAQSQVSESHNLLHNLNAMLKWSDAEAVMNAAGTLSTMAETSDGRHWFLNDSDFKGIVDNVTALLDSANEWTSSNAALVLARISLCEDGCRKLLEQPNSQHTLRKLVASLGVDEAGCGMNAAFTLGRFCDLDIGRKQIFNMKEASNAIETLEKMMASGDAGGSRNACFALSCLATDKEGHGHILINQVFPEILDTLCGLVESEEQESAWFAAMAFHVFYTNQSASQNIWTLKVLASQPKGVVKLRAHPKLVALLKTVACSRTAGKDLLEEVNFTLRRLLPLSQPTPPRTEVLNATTIRISWNEVVPESGLGVTYRLCDGDRVLYEGCGCEYVLSAVKPGDSYSLGLHVSTEGDAGRGSELCAVAVPGGPVPGRPLGLRQVGCTPTQVKLGWGPPGRPDAIPIDCYLVRLDDKLIQSTAGLTCTVSGLRPSTGYEFSVCASAAGRERGERAWLRVRTPALGDHAPGKLRVSVLGRSEMFIAWEAPLVPLGRLFSFELRLNGKVVYLGTERSFTARRLPANTEHACSVSAVTSEGKCQSRTVTRKTAKEGKTSRYFYSFSRTNHLKDSTKRTSEAGERLGKSKSQACVQREQCSVKGPKSSRFLTKGDQKGTRKQCENVAMPRIATDCKRASQRSSLTDSSEVSSDCNDHSPLSEAVKPNATLIQDLKTADARLCVGDSLNVNGRENLEIKAGSETGSRQLSLQGDGTGLQSKASADVSQACLEKLSPSQRTRNTPGCARAARAVVCSEIYNVNAHLETPKPTVASQRRGEAEAQPMQRDWWKNGRERSPNWKDLKCKTDAVQQPMLVECHSNCGLHMAPITIAGSVRLWSNTLTQPVKEEPGRLKHHFAIADSKRPLLPNLNRRTSSPQRLQSSTTSTSICGNWQGLWNRSKPEPTRELAVKMGVNLTAQRDAKTLIRAMLVLPNSGQSVASKVPAFTNQFRNAKPNQWKGQPSNVLGGMFYKGQNYRTFLRNQLTMDQHLQPLSYVQMKSVERRKSQWRHQLLGDEPS